MNTAERWTGRPCWAEVDLDAIAHNVRTLTAIAHPARVYAVVKANAYGHGAVAVAHAAVDAGASGLAVVCVDEGEELRLGGIDAPILLVGQAQVSEAEHIVGLRLTPTVTSMQTAIALSRFAIERGVAQPVHIELESGLNRNGLLIEDLVQFAESVRRLPGIEIEGMYTHFAAAEEGDSAFTRGQHDALIAASERLPWIPIKHCSASASVLGSPHMALDMVRCGLAVYGYHPAPDNGAEHELRPALSLKSRIARIIDIPEGGTVGYGRTWTASRPSRIALIMCGYADGYRRALSNRASVLVRGHRAPIAGRIAMDMCMADVTDVPNAAPDDEVVLIGRQPPEPIATRIPYPADAEAPASNDGTRNTVPDAEPPESIDADDLATLAGTISWEILAGIPARVPRLYIREGRIVAHTTLNERLPLPTDTPTAIS